MDQNQLPLVPYAEPKTEDEFIDAINKTGDLVVVEFFAPQYEYCRKHAGMFANLANANRGPGLWFVRADCNHLKTFVQQCRHEYKITSFPSYIIFHEKSVLKRLEIRPTVPEDDADLQRRVESWMSGN